MCASLFCAVCLAVLPQDLPCVITAKKNAFDSFAINLNKAAAETSDGEARPPRLSDAARIPQRCGAAAPRRALPRFHGCFFCRACFACVFLLVLLLWERWGLYLPQVSGRCRPVEHTLAALRAHEE